MFRKFLVVAVFSLVALMIPCPGDSTFAGEKLKGETDNSFLSALVNPFVKRLPAEPGGLFGGTKVISRAWSWLNDNGGYCEEKLIRVIWEWKGEEMTGWHLAVVCSY